MSLAPNHARDPTIGGSLYYLHVSSQDKNSRNLLQEAVAWLECLQVTDSLVCIHREEGCLCFPRKTPSQQPVHQGGLEYDALP